MQKKQQEIETKEGELTAQEVAIVEREKRLDQQEREIAEMERAMQEMQREMNQNNAQGGVAASTVAGTDYICGHSGDNATDYNNEDGVNIGANDDDDIEESMCMNVLYGKDQIGGLLDNKFLRGDLSVSNSVADLPHNLRGNQSKMPIQNVQSIDLTTIEKQKSSDAMHDDNQNSILQNYFNGLGADSGLGGHGGNLQTLAKPNANQGSSSLTKSQSVGQDAKNMHPPPKLHGQRGFSCGVDQGESSTSRMAVGAVDTNSSRIYQSKSIRNKSKLSQNSPRAGANLNRQVDGSFHSGGLCLAEQTAPTANPGNPGLNGTHSSFLNGL